ncbi:MAG: VWA domain-containing protein [Vicinamibacterales bacterium]
MRSAFASRRLSLLVAASLVLAAGSPGRAQDSPRFSSSVELLSVDATVVDDRGVPLTDLTAADFSVEVDGDPRRVISAEWVPLAAADVPPPAEPVPAGYTSNEGVGAGRLILFVIDQPSIRFGGTLDIQEALGSFIDRLQPTDRMAAIGVGPGSMSTPFTSDRRRIKEAIGRMTGSRLTLDLVGQPNMTLSEAVDIYGGSFTMLDYVLARECAGLVGLEYSACRISVENAANTMAQESFAAGRQTSGTLRFLLGALASIEAPKTMVFVSEGFIEQDPAALTEINRLAAASRTAIHVLRVIDQGMDVAVQDRSNLMGADRFAAQTTLEEIAENAGGTFFNIVSGADSALSRIESGITGYYLLGVESRPEDTDGNRHRIDVEVENRDANVRWWREIASKPAGPAPDSIQAAVNALNSPVMQSALPLRVATFSLPDPGRDTVQLLLHAAIGTEFVSANPATIAYAIADGTGRIVETQRLAAMLSPVMSSVPSPLQFRSTAELPAGEYTLRFAAVQGDLTGTVEHPVHLGLVPAGSIQLGDLVVGGPVDAVEPLLPSIGHAVYFGLLHGYLEASGAEAARMRVRYEVATAEDAPALMALDVEPRRTSNGRTVFTDFMEIRRLPDGEYVLRAIVLDGESPDARPLSTIARRFEVAPPPVALAPAEGGGGSLAAGPAEVFLPVADGRLARPFERQQAAQRGVVQAFRDRVDSSVMEAFDRGVSLLADGEYARAESSFKSAVQISADSTAPIAYLGATFAAAGQDLQAVGAWQTALIDGDDLPQIYLWLADALIRTRDMAQARSVLEEAAAKWPGDVRFAKPTALVYATVGLGREAVRSIERHLEAEPGDVEALSMAVEWIYHLRTAGAVARNPAEDVRNARQYAEAYERAKGPQLALVREWMSAIEGR